MADLTIPARLVAEGVGLPPIWRCRSRSTGRDIWADEAHRVTDDDLVVLSDRQSAFGVAVLLDKWADALPGQDHISARRLQDLRELRDLVTHIGMDHAVRRALGWAVEPGTLAKLRAAEARRTPEGVVVSWVLEDPGPQGFFFGFDSLDITDPDEALAAICAELAQPLQQPSR